MKMVDLTGMRFDRLIVLCLGPKLGTRISWLCKCSCGNEKVISGTSLQSSKVKSCGCLRIEMSAKPKKITHGYSYRPEYKAWRSMIYRCNSSTCPYYKNYGGRGIKVCDRWLKFENFIKDMGNRPIGKYSLDRINNDGNYEPGNCRWTTFEVQVSNKRSCRYLELNGESLTVSQWARRMGVHRNLIFMRLDNGWPIDKAIQQKSSRPIC